jgi:hypothetical protein
VVKPRSRAGSFFMLTRLPSGEPVRVGLAALRIRRPPSSQ